MVQVRKIEPEPVNPRVRFRALLEQMMNEHPEMSTGELADYAATRLPEEDRQLVEAFLASEARTILAFELRIHHSKARHSIFSAIAIHDQEAPKVAELSERRQDTLYSRIEQWREYVPGQNRTRPLLELKRTDLLDSANFDMQKAFTFGYKGLFKQRLAEGMPNDDVTVGQQYSDEEILAMGEQLKEEMGRGNFRLKLRPVRPLPGRTSVP